MKTFSRNTGEVRRTPESPVDAGPPVTRSPRSSGSLTKYIGYSVSFVSFCAGIIFLTGLFLPATIPVQLRVMCGVVFVLMAAYRFFATRYKLQSLESGDL